MPDWNRGQIRAEWMARGFHHMEADGTPRLNGLVQKAVEEIVEEAPWAFRYVEEETTLPVTIADPGDIDQVLHNGRPLRPQNIDQLRDRFPSLTGSAGAPRYYYLRGEELATYPATEDALTVVYYSSDGWYNDGVRGPVALTDEAVPVIPSRYRDLIVELLCVYGQADSEDFEERDAARAEYDSGLEQMRRVQLHPIRDEQKRIRIASGEDWA